MADVTVDRDGTGGDLPRRFREVAPGVFAQEVVLAQPLAGVQKQPTAASTPVPVAADVVGGRGAAAGAVVLTVPAGRTWRGVLELAASAVAAIGAAAANRSARLDLAGVGATPAAGVLLEVPLALPVTAATATMGAGASLASSTSLVIVAAAVDAVVTLQGDATTMRASARGELLGLA